MRMAAIKGCLLFGAIFVLGLGCTVCEPAERPLSFEFPEELIKNFTDAYNENDFQSVVACLSKDLVKKGAAQLRNGKGAMERFGFTHKDMELSDEDFFTKAVAIIVPQDKQRSQTPESGITFNIEEATSKGDKGQLKIKNNWGDEMGIDIVRENESWKINDDYIFRACVSKKSRIEHLGGGVVALYDINAAQMLYKERFQTYGTLAQLGEAGFLTKKEIASGMFDNWKLIETVPTNTSWEITTESTTSEYHATYKMDQTGVLMVKQPGLDDFLIYNP